jgi:hypothetical protein
MTGPNPTIPAIPTDHPTEILDTWHNAFAAIEHARQIEAQLPALDDQIAKAQARLDWLKSQHKQAGRDMTAALTSSETRREMVELWCTKHSRPLPPEPTPAQPPAVEGTGPHALPAPQRTPCQDDPPRCGDCTDLFCPCGHHQAQREAFEEETARRVEILGAGVAGETTTVTRVDDPEGGGDAAQAPFQPAPPADERANGRGRRG